MKLTSFLPHFRRDDGSYSSICLEKEVNISFFINDISLKMGKSSNDKYFEQITLYKYKFSGEITQVYQDKINDSIGYGVIDTGIFKFYLVLPYVNNKRDKNKDTFTNQDSYIMQQGEKRNPLNERQFCLGDKINGIGELWIDPVFYCFEDLLYNLKTTKIIKVKHLTEPLYRPSPLSLIENNEAELTEVDNIVGYDSEFRTDFIIEFDSEGMEGKVIPETYGM